MTRKFVNVNAKLFRKWIDALRSGRYEQGKHRLHKVHPVGESHTYCCLGVLGDILAETHDDIRWEDPAKCATINKTITIPLIVDRVGVDGQALIDRMSDDLYGFMWEEYVKAPPNLDRQDLIGMNDGTGKFGNDPKTFEEIADYIEKAVDEYANLRIKAARANNEEEE